jgi:hypothetical protein
VSEAGQECMSELKVCPFCKKLPVKFSSTVVHVGCEFSAFIVECDNEDDSSVLPFIEHRLSVYGVDENQATERWNETVGFK